MSMRVSTICIPHTCRVLPCSTTRDVWVLLGTVARSTHFEGDWGREVPQEENKNLLEGRSAMASYLIRGSILSSPLHNFESHSSGDQERCNEFILRCFFSLLLCSYLENCETLNYVGKRHGVVPSANLFSKEIQDCLTFRGRWENTTLRPGWLVLAVTLQR